MKKSQIVYIEDKDDSITGAGRIGRVTFSKTGKTIYYRGQQFQSLRGVGFKANYFKVDTGEEYWISGPRRDGNDALYPMSIEIDDDVREEYWREIRDRPDLKNKTSFRSTGKYSRRKPHPELSVGGKTKVGGNRGGMRAGSK